MNAPNTPPPATPKLSQPACSNCNLSNLCLPVGLDHCDLHRLDVLINKRRVIEAGNYVFHAGEDFIKLIAVRSGAFKTIMLSSTGEQQIIGFYFPGELLGFDGINTGKYAVSCIALETSSICEIPFNELLVHAAQIPNLQRQLVNLMSQKITPEFAVRVNTTAEQRIASFLLSISRRLKSCGYSEHEFNLPMSREDIGNYLGLATETVSRILTNFHQQGLLNVSRRHVCIQDFRKLQIITCADHTA